MDTLELTGRARTHLAAVPGLGCALHIDVVAPFLALRRAAEGAGFDLRPVSGFRDFERQLAIWNEKFNGQRPVVGANGEPLDLSGKSAAERVAAILIWSALPGGSRHHWGTDLDVIDAAAVPPGYRVALTADEFASAGPFGRLNEWLSGHAARFGFFRPFRGALSGVRPEPWHLSFAPVSEPARRALRPAVLREALVGAGLLGKAEVVARLDELHARYVQSIDWP